jgi:oligoendopeptidase F
MLSNIPHKFTRIFVPEELDFSSWANVEPLFNTLLNTTLDTPETLEIWLRDRSELLDVVGEEGSLRYIRMTCDTGNEALEKAYYFYLDEIAEKAKLLDDRLKRKYLESAARRLLSSSRYEVLDRSFQNSSDLFREANVLLETKESKLSQQYQKLIGSMTVKFEGQELTLQQMGRYLEYPDRKVRDAAWTKVMRRRLEEREVLENLFDQLLSIRNRIAANAGFSSYREYAFRHLERFNYRPEDCLLFHEGVETAVVPLARRLQQERARELGIDPLRPWDLHVDPKNRPPLRPFATVQELVEGVSRIAGKIDTGFGTRIRIMQSLNLLDLESRKGKAPGGYQSALAEARLPFIFMNAVGLDSDVRTLLHEFGHALHVFATQQEPLGDYRQAPTEFCEVASMSMELLGGEFLSVFYPRPEDLKRSLRGHLEDILSVLPWIASVDAFQHWIYTHPGHRIQEREEQWLLLHRRFGGVEDWKDFEEAQRTGWHRQLHIFELPFYYIEYAIAQLGALQLWLNSRKNFRQAVEDYWATLQLGGSRPLPELFRRANIQFEFGPGTLEPLMKTVENELLKMK